MVYGGPRRRNPLELFIMGIEIANFIGENTEDQSVVEGEGMYGKRPGSRSVRISYDIDATPDHNPHLIEIHDPSPIEEERLERGLREIYERNKFFKVQ